ncbi:hypothetical protein C8R47DRAFT_1069919 [Mycena vitilis]|nr:hypothetical protein C8R47DRAFT_1069919 [Mycena vitilis]
MAEKRAAIKANRRKSDRPRPLQSMLAASEEVASQALATMLKRKTAQQQCLNHVQVLPGTSDSSVGSDPPDADGEGGQWRRRWWYINSEVSPMLKKEKADIDEASSDELELRSARYVLELRGRVETYDNSARALIRVLKDRRAARIQKLRLPTPVSNSPSPEPEGPLPNLLEKLLDARR